MFPILPVEGHPAMRPLQQLFHLEVEFYRKLRSHANTNADEGDLHTSYALQCGYEELLRAAWRVTPLDIDRLKSNLLPTSDPRDLLAARNAVKQLFGIFTLEAEESLRIARRLTTPATAVRAY
jgi:hypothetical protein